MRKTDKVVEDLLHQLQSLDWTKTVTGVDGRVGFAHPDGSYCTKSDATRSRATAQEALFRWTVPHLASKYGVPYCEDHHDKLKGDMAWATAARDPRVKAEVTRLVREARECLGR